MNRATDKIKSPTGRKWLVTFRKSQLGLTVTEYAVAAGLIAATLTVSMSTLGITIDAIITTVIAFL